MGVVEAKAVRRGGSLTSEEGETDEADREDDDERRSR